MIRSVIVSCKYLEIVNLKFQYQATQIVFLWDKLFIAITQFNYDQACWPKELKIVVLLLHLHDDDDPEINDNKCPII